MNPDTGEVQRQTTLTSGTYDGLAALGGYVYAIETSADRILVVNPATGSVTRTLDLRAANPGFYFGGGLGEITGPDSLIATLDSPNSNEIAFVDPQTGRITSRFSHGQSFSDYGLTSVGQEIFVGFSDNRIRVYNRSGTLQRTLTENFPIFSLGGSAGSDGSHRLTLGVGELRTGVNFGNQSIFGEIRGTKFEDLDGDGVRDAGEPAMAGVTVYIDRNNDGVLDSGGLIEPDNYSAGTQLNTIDAQVTLTAVGSYIFGPQVVSMAPPRIDLVSTGGLVLGNGNSASHVWFDTRQLRMDFSSPVLMVSIDFIGDNNPGYTDQGRLDVFDAGGNLLGTYLTGQLGLGDVETMKIERPTADIAYALAGGIDINNAGLLDRLTFNNGTVAEPTAVTDAGGQYAFTGLVPGDYVVREVVPAGYAQTAPAKKPSRLFTVNISSRQLVELHPTTGPCSGHSRHRARQRSRSTRAWRSTAKCSISCRMPPPTSCTGLIPTAEPSLDRRLCGADRTTAWRRWAAWCMSSKPTRIRSSGWTRPPGPSGKRSASAPSIRACRSPVAWARSRTPTGW